MPDSAVKLQLERKIGDVGQGLSQALNALMAELPGRPAQPVGLSKVLGVNRDLARRVLIAARQDDPLAAAQAMPGAEALRTLLKAAKSRKVGSSVLQALEDAIAAFEELLSTTVAGRPELDTLLSAWLPESRSRFELSNRQLAFRSISALKGLMAEAIITTGLIHPAADDCCVILLVNGAVGLRRLRPGVPIHLTTTDLTRPSEQSIMTTLAGEPIDTDHGNVWLTDFCSADAESFQIRRCANVVHHTILGDGIGPKSGQTVFRAEVQQKVYPDYKNPEPGRKRGIISPIYIPARLVVLDVLVHDSVWPGRHPELFIHDASFNGLANVNDPSREVDRLDFVESIQRLGHGTGRCRIAEYADYVKLIRHCCETLGWDGEQLRGYRCRMQYPLYGSQLTLAFDPAPVLPGVAS
jgi:hypothetical protein